MNLKNNIALVLVLVVVVTAGCSGETTGAPKTPSSSATNSSNPPAEKTAATPQTSAPVADNSSLAPEAVDDLSPEAESTSAAAKPEVAEKASKEPESLPIVHLSEQHKATCKVQVGQQMPDLELVDTNGEPKKLSAFLGERVTVVCFWDAENPFSAWQLSDLGPEVVERFAAQGLNVIAINRGQSAADARAAAEKAGVKFPILVDEDGKAFDQVATEYIPRTYLLDASGMVLWLDLDYSDETRRQLNRAIQVALANAAIVRDTIRQ